MPIAFRTFFAGSMFEPTAINARAMPVTSARA
jgi:hypothetical protein